MRASQFVFKAVRRLYSNYERSRSYPQRQRIWDYSFTCNDRQERVFLIITAGDQINNAAWTAASFLTQSALIRESFGLVFCLDGPAKPAGDEQKLASSFPRARILTSSTILSELGTELPQLVRFANYHPMGRKLASLVAFNRLSDVLYSDSDVLGFAPPTELEEAIEEHRPTYIGQSEASYDSVTLARIRSEGLQPPDPPLNAGFVFAHRAGVPGELANRLSPDPEKTDPSSPTWWWIEQTILSGLFGRLGATVLPMDRYVVSLKRQLPFEEDVDYSRICVRHFVAPVRHLMYKKGIPLLLAKGRHQWKLRQCDRSRP
jgi:hypothetical protein